jgi:hypothetical protein
MRHPLPQVDPNKKGAVYRYDQQVGWKELSKERPLRKGKCPLAYWETGWQPSGGQAEDSGVEERCSV